MEQTREFLSLPVIGHDLPKRTAEVIQRRSSSVNDIIYGGVDSHSEGLQADCCRVNVSICYTNFSASETLRNVRFRVIAPFSSREKKSQAWNSM